MRSGFSIVPLRRIARVQNGGTPGPHESNWEGDVPWATPVDLGRVHGGYLQATERSITATGLQSGSTLAPAGSVLISSRAPIGYAAIAGMDTAFNQGCKALIPLPGVSQARFLKYAVESQMSTLQAAGRGSTFTEVSASDVASLPVPVTSLAKQDRIADYLDRETAEIDAFIADCSSMVSILEEQESAFAASLLTHGLNSSVSVTKNHGMLWLEGESIPSHWTRMKLGFLVRMKSGDAISSEDIEAEGSYPVFGGGGFRGYTSTWNITGAHVLIGRQGALCGKVFISEGDAFATEHAIVTYPKIDLDLRWLEGLLRFMNLGQYSQSAAQPGIGVESISKLYVPVPPISEQIKIGDSLRRHQEKKSALLLELKSAIILAHERRSALISAAVTGQIEVSAQGVSAADHLRDELEVHV